jgi:hypothetical protein
VLGPEDQLSYTYRKKSGIDLPELLKITDRFGGIDKTKAKDLGYEILPSDAWIEQDVDILIPAAIENQITAEKRRPHQPARENHLRRRQRPDDAGSGQRDSLNASSTSSLNSWRTRAASPAAISSRCRAT